MKYFFSLILFFASVISTEAVAQQSQPQSSNTDIIKNHKGCHGLGLILSSANGKGLSYRYWPGIYGVHVSFVPADMGDQKYYNGGITGYARIKRYSVGDLFLHVGVEYEYRSRTETNYLYSSTGYYDTYRVNGKGLNMGFGPGFHVVQKAFSFDLFAGYGAYMVNEYSNDVNAILDDRFLMSISGGIAIYLNL
jgi:hypothetical protein